MDPEQVARILEADKDFSHVCIVHCETSTGILNNIRRVGEVVKKHIPGKSLPEPFLMSIFNYVSETPSVMRPHERW